MAQVPFNSRLLKSVLNHVEEHGEGKKNLQLIQNCRQLDGNKSSGSIGLWGELQLVVIKTKD